jgi:hypothetical protein
VSFTAITLCVASQRVFIVVRVKCGLRFLVISEMADLKEHRICVKCCFKLGKTASKTHEMIKTAFGDNAMGRTQTFEWFSRFKTWIEHQEHVGDLFCSPGICSSRPNDEPASLPGDFETFEGASPPKTSGTMVEPGLVASL